MKEADIFDAITILSLLAIFFLGFWVGSYYEYHSHDGHLIDDEWVWVE